MTAVFIKGDIWTREMSQGENHVKMEAEAGVVMLLEAKECQRLHANHQRFREP